MPILHLLARRRRNGAIPPGKLTGAWLLPPAEVRGGGYVPLHVGAAVERRDEAEEVARPPQQGLREFPGIVEAESQGGFGPSNR